MKVGEGYGGAAIRDNEVYLLDREDSARDVLRCFSLKTGKELWKQEFEAEGRLSYNGSRSTPTVGKDRVYAHGPFGHVYCVDRKTQKVVWTRDLKKEYEFDNIPHRWGFAQSPLLHDGKVIVCPSISGAVGLVAFDAETGKEIWNNKSFRGQNYASPMQYKIGGMDQIMVLTSRSIVGVDPENGKTLWSTSDYRNRTPIPVATPLGDDRFFITSGYNSGSCFLKVEKNGDSWDATVSNKIRKGAQIHPAILVKDHLFINLNENSNLRRDSPNLACLDLKGNILWEAGDKLPIDRGSLISVDGLLVVLAGTSGYLHLIEPDSSGLKTLASAKIFPQQRKNFIWAAMAYSNGKLIVRDQSRLKCLELGKVRKEY